MGNPPPPTTNPPPAAPPGLRVGALLGGAGSGLLTPVAALPVGDGVAGGVAGAHPTAVARTTAPRTTGIPRRILIT